MISKKMQFQINRDIKVVARNLRNLLCDQEMSQTDLAKGIGVPQPTISRLVSEVSMPRLSTVKAIAYFFGITVDDLLKSYDIRLEVETTLLAKVTNLLTWKRKSDIEKS